MKKIALISLIVSSVLMAGGYKIPENSLNSVALSAANIAHSRGSDAAYYNPANMMFMEDGSSMSLDLTYIGLDASNYKGTIAATGTFPYDADAESETFLVPSFHYVFPIIDGARFGLSVVTPGGVTKRWSVAPGIYSAEEYTLQVVEINPSIAYSINDKVAVAFGLRVIHSDGTVKSSTTATRNMTGDSFDYGFNLALSYKPTSELEIGLTYRSNVDLTEEGSAKLSHTTLGEVYNGGVSVTVPLPVSLNLAVAYTLASKTTIEFVYERNLWSSYEALDFDYSGSVAPLTVFDDAIAKDWKDTNAFRLGLTHELDLYTLMAGAVYDNSPVPDKSLSFELPDSDSLSVSLGVRYQVNEKLNVGLAALYSMKDNRSAVNSDLSGKFSNSKALLVSVGAWYKF